jgi:hypothetical protein
MTKVKSVNAVALAQPAQPTVDFDRADTIARLSKADAKQRVVILTALPMGEIAAIGGKIANIGASVNEALNVKLCEKHGKDWAKVYATATTDLSDADKTRKKQIHESLEGLRATIQANTGGNKDKARDILRRVKEWGMGVHQNKQSNPKGNAKQNLDVWALSWDNFPTAYRRIHNDPMETMTKEQSDAMLVVHDAMAAYFKVCNISAQAVLDCSGKKAWNF